MDKLFIGTIDGAGKVVSRPVIGSFDSEGQLAGWHYLTGHEPHSTLFSPTLLRI
ncbi:MAG: hypothetical protein NC301_03120 [Bacteroides sp.]|nr:hypothetical protein [Bacteroides sp.]MCM1378985.1 hypothetical protein [Bacteroides sp.]MCM1445601.1 hypothetical protein [Prevotella sp.]